MGFVSIGGSWSKFVVSFFELGLYSMGFMEACPIVWRASQRLPQVQVIRHESHKSTPPSNVVFVRD